MKRIQVLALVFLTILAGSCRRTGTKQSPEDVSKPEFLELEQVEEGVWRAVSISPFDGSRDTLLIGDPVEKLVCMSTSYVGFLEAIGCDSIIKGVSGVDYLYSSSLDAEEVGYDSAPDYERIVSLDPDLLLAYSVSAAKSPFFSKLESLGVRVFIVNEHLERHPLARASYIRLFGALAGNIAAADSVFASVRDSYRSLADSVAASVRQPRKVLMNIPYNDQWFIPSADNYLSRLVDDAGGVVLGSGSGKAASSTISLEKAYSLSKEADCWLNVGWCRTMDQLLGVSPLFPDMVGNITANASRRGFDEGSVVWNDNARMSRKGGNDIWQSGVVRPDLVLRDLVGILHPSGECKPLYYRGL
ncbi:MAG: ABC transporter substrate-binding protein [Bacteroidales bacterium]|nr:ABC transporter substrate-binding protein [Bacteroidales bacterium]